MTLLHTNRAPVWGQMERWGSRGGWSEAGPELPHTSAHSPRPCGLCRGPRPRRGPRPVSCPQRAPCRWAALSAVWSSRALCAPLRAALALFSQELVISPVLRTVPRSLWPPRSLGLSLCQPYGSVEAEAVGVLARAAPAPSADLFPPSPRLCSPHVWDAAEAGVCPATASSAGPSRLQAEMSRAWARGLPGRGGPRDPLSRGPSREPAGLCPLS